MTPEFLPSVWGRWRRAVGHLKCMDKLPIRGQRALENVLHSHDQKDNTIEINLSNRQFFIHLIEVSLGKFDIVALSVTKKYTKRLGGEGMVIVEQYATHAKAADHHDSIPGMEIMTINHSGIISMECCQEVWPNLHGFNPNPWVTEPGLASVAIERSLRIIVREATKRRRQAQSFGEVELEEEFPVGGMEKMGEINRLNRDLSAPRKKTAAILASRGNGNTIKVKEQLSTETGISSMNNAIDDLQRSATTNTPAQARCHKPSQKSSSIRTAADIADEYGQIQGVNRVESLGSSRHRDERSQKTIKALEEDIKKMKQSHSQEKLQLRSEIQRATKAKERLERTKADLKEGVEFSPPRARGAEEEVKNLTCQRPADLARAKITRNSPLNSPLRKNYATNDLVPGMHKSNHFQPRKECQNEPESRTGEQLSEIQQNSSKRYSKGLDLDDEEFMNFIGICEKESARISDLGDELQALEKTSKHKSGKSTKPAQQIIKQVSIIGKSGGAASEESEKQHRIFQLERELEMTKEALKNKTNELASVKEQHAKEQVEAGGNKEKCRCKDKEAYLESVEEHVEKLRGTMEDVLRHVSTYQGRKRRRTEGPDFEY